ncbi:hypothetical protein ACFYQA_02335 [Streptomyces sp. NPDC005774]|uniref:hypothetical protein n=1 Tax=Streptomyces sp. NPDC005774 TaxID=3364728 RepID=UPI0036A06638
MGLFSRKAPNLLTEAGNRQAAETATKKAKKARRAGDHEFAGHCDAYATEALKQAEMAKRHGR